jgi:hypothetical protein
MSNRIECILLSAIFQNRGSGILELVLESFVLHAKMSYPQFSGIISESRTVDFFPRISCARARE